uniref:RING-type domain-containing protein n=1 Tax=Amblyomma maculatum TaxID=34609 RepID=G3MRE6_AMBMU
MAGAERASAYQTREFVAGVNWRPTRFADDVPPWSVCSLCRVVAMSSVLLPCSHILCEPCRGGSVRDGESLCPLDGEAFCDEECQHAKLPARKADGLKVSCLVLAIQSRMQVL